MTAPASSIPPPAPAPYGQAPLKMVRALLPSLEPSPRDPRYRVWPQRSLRDLAHLTGLRSPSSVREHLRRLRDPQGLAVIVEEHPGGREVVDLVRLEELERGTPARPRRSHPHRPSRPHLYVAAGRDDPDPAPSPAAPSGGRLRAPETDLALDAAIAALAAAAAAVAAIVQQRSGVPDELAPTLSQLAGCLSNLAGGSRAASARDPRGVQDSEHRAASGVSKESSFIPVDQEISSPSSSSSSTDQHRARGNHLTPRGGRTGNKAPRRSQRAVRDLLARFGLDEHVNRIEGVVSALDPYTDEQVEHAVAKIARDAHAFENPVSWLVNRAKQGDPTYFPESPSPTTDRMADRASSPVRPPTSAVVARPKVEVTFEVSDAYGSRVSEVECHVTDLESDPDRAAELADLDERVSAWLSTNPPAAHARRVAGIALEPDHETRVQFLLATDRGVGSKVASA